MRACRRSGRSRLSVRRSVGGSRRGRLQRDGDGRRDVRRGVGLGGPGRCRSNGPSVHGLTASPRLRIGCRFHATRTPGHRLLVVGGGRPVHRGRRGHAHELELVLAELDQVVVAQDMPLRKHAVDEGSVGAAQVLEDAVVHDGDDRRMLAADREVVDVNVVVRLAADRRALLRQGNFLEHDVVQTQYQFRHSRPRSPTSAIGKNDYHLPGRAGRAPGRPGRV